MNRLIFWRNGLLMTVLLMLLCGSAWSQFSDPYVKNVFGSTTMINTWTVQHPPQRGFEFNLAHRFGLIDLQEGKLIHEFFGMDLVANIRFGFNFYIVDNLSIGFGRTKVDKQYDVNIHYSILRQKKDNSIPLSLSVYGNVAVMTDDWPVLPEYPYYSDSITPFEYTFSHRLSYFFQIMIARQFTRWLSIQVTPMIGYKNLINLDNNYTVNNDNYTLAVSLGAWIKTGLRHALMVEWTPVFNKPEFNREGIKYYDNFSIGWEIRPVGHSFQIILTNSSQILPQDILSKRSYNFFEGQFYLGFNLHRNLYYRKR